MNENFSRDVLQQLSRQALAQAGIPIVPEVQHEVEQQLADILFPRFESKEAPNFSNTFSQLALAQLRGQLQQSLQQSFAHASLAALAELALPTAQTTQPPARPVATPEMLAGLSEQPEEMLGETSAASTTQTTSASSAPPTISPYPETIPEDQLESATPASAAPGGSSGAATRPPQRRRTRQQSHRRTKPLAPGEFTEEAAAEALGDEVVPEEETVEQYKERAIANALAAEKRRRAARGQATPSGQQEAAYSYGLNMVANEGAQIGNKLKEGIHSGKFTSFYICLLLALVKDIGEPLALAYFDPGITGTILSVFIGGLLTALLLGEGVRFRRWLIKKFFGKAITAFIIGLIPGVNVVFPEYTVGVLLMGYDNFHYIRGLKQQLQALEGQMSNLKKLAASGVRGLAKAQQRLNPIRAAAND